MLGKIKFTKPKVKDGVNIGNFMINWEIRTKFNINKYNIFSNKSFLEKTLLCFYWKKDNQFLGEVNIDVENIADMRTRWRINCT